MENCYEYCSTQHGRTPCRTTRMNTNYEPPLESTYGNQQYSTEPQSNFQTYEATPRPATRCPQFRPRRIGLGYSAVDFETPRTEVLESARASSQIQVPRNSQFTRRRACFDGGPGQPLIFPDKDGDKAPSSQVHHDRYLDSGRPLSLGNFREDRTQISQGPFDPNHAANCFTYLPDYTEMRTPNLQGPNDRYLYSGRPLSLGNFREDRAQTSQRPLDSNPNLSDATERRTPNLQVQSDRYNDSGRPLTLGDFRGDRSQNTQRPLDPNQVLSCSTNLSDFVGRRTPNLQVQLDRYKDSGRPLTLGNFREDRAQNTQRPFNSKHDLNCSMNLSDFAGRRIPNLQRPLDPNQVVSCSTNLSDFAGRRTPNLQYNRDGCPKPSEGARVQSMVLFSLAIKYIPYKDYILKTTGLRTKCPNLPQEQLMKLLQNCDFGEKPTIARNPLFGTLVKDNYYPGAIEDAVNGRIDFNRVAFDASFEAKKIPKQIEPKDVPMSLLEAFEQRIDYEFELQKKLEGRKEFCLNEMKGRADSTGSKQENEEEITSEEVKFWTHRDELKLASTVDIDMASNTREYPQTALTLAICSLFKAEKMNEFDTCVHLAEKAIRSASPNQHEKAALKSTCPFHIDVHADEVKAKKTYRPIEIISYVGTTKPAE